MQLEELLAEAPQRCRLSIMCHHWSCIIYRVGQNRISAPYMTVCMVIPLLRIPYVHRYTYKCMVLANPMYVRYCWQGSYYINGHRRRIIPRRFWPTLVVKYWYQFNLHRLPDTMPVIDTQYTPHCYHHWNYGTLLQRNYTGSVRTLPTLIKYCWQPPPTEDVTPKPQGARAGLPVDDGPRSAYCVEHLQNMVTLQLCTTCKCACVCVCLCACVCVCVCVCVCECVSEMASCGEGVRSWTDLRVMLLPSLCNPTALYDLKAYIPP